MTELILSVLKDLYYVVESLDSTVLKKIKNQWKK